MRRSKLIALVLGIFLILFAPLLGYFLSFVCLSLLGGMGTDSFLLIMDHCMTGFQIIGILSAAYGILNIRS